MKEGGPVRIREYDDTRDREALRACSIELQDFERRFDTRMPEGARISEAYLCQLFEDCRRSDGAIFVADDDGEVVGYAYVLAHLVSEDVSDGPDDHALLSDLLVLDSHRDRGIGRALMERSESYARERGARYLRISALAENRVARGLYASQGFEEREIILEKILDP